MHIGGGVSEDLTDMQITKSCEVSAAASEQSGVYMDEIIRSHQGLGALQVGIAKRSSQNGQGGRIGCAESHVDGPRCVWAYRCECGAIQTFAREASFTVSASGYRHRHDQLQYDGDLIMARASMARHFTSTCAQTRSWILSTARVVRGLCDRTCTNCRV